MAWTGDYIPVQCNQSMGRRAGRSAPAFQDITIFNNTALSPEHSLLDILEHACVVHKAHARPHVCWVAPSPSVPCAPWHLGDDEGKGSRKVEADGAIPELQGKQGESGTHSRLYVGRSP